jgi:hypothetical protein
LRLRAKLSDVEVATRRAALLSLIGSLELVELDTVFLDRASQPMPTELGTLDAIHLATALLWKDMTGVPSRWRLTIMRWASAQRRTACPSSAQRNEIGAGVGNRVHTPLARPRILSRETNAIVWAECRGFLTRTFTSR